MTGFEQLIDIDLTVAVQVFVLGLVGGLLSGFMGTGGAFFMTPGMMNLGVTGVLAVGSNIAHKFGKALIGARTHAEMGHVDYKLGLYLSITALIGVQLAAMINKGFYQSAAAASNAADRAAAGDLYISVVFVLVLAVISAWMLRDFIRSRRPDHIPETRVAERLARLRLTPMITFRVADIRVSFWLVCGVGLMIGYLAGTIGVGGFLGVPAMIYVFGVPTMVAAGTELFLAIFVGAWGTIAYAWDGFVDLRLAFLLYLGSLLGVYLGAYGTKIVKETILRFVTGGVILICVISRAIKIPVYLGELGQLSISADLANALNLLSTVTLYLSGAFGLVMILTVVARGWLQHRKVLTLLRSFER